MTSELGDILKALDDLLEHERAALLVGDLKSLTAMASRKEVLFDAMNALEDLDAAVLGQLDIKVKRNQILLNSALDGIRKVARRVAAFRRVRASLETYNANGEKSLIDIQAETSVEKRA